MDGQRFTSTGVLSLLVRGLRRVDPALVAEIAVPDPMDRAVTPDAVKRTLIDRALREHGPGALLAAGQEMDRAEDTPVLTVLRQSPDPAVIAAKWMRLERYSHASHRSRITSEAAALRCTRISRGAPASAGENWLIAGILFGLVTGAGYADARLRIAGQEVTRETWAAVRTGTPTDVFSIHWTARARTAPAPARDATPGDRLTDILISDPGRGWRIAEAAGLLSVSARSLQRHLAREGRSWSTELRRARMREAVRLLGTDAGLADIGYCCGYADQAHFQRDFRRVTNLTPRRFRQIAAEGAVGEVGAKFQ